MTLKIASVLPVWILVLAATITVAVVSPGHEQDGIIEMPGGQSGHPLSPFWGAGHAAWVEGNPTPFLPGPVKYTLTLLPATR